MDDITIRILDGSDRGREFGALVTPITIGREEGNTIQLNDERVSRFHVKIQEDKDRLVLTDLESTNGTKVNGEDIRLRILRFGDLISIGRSVLLFGTREQIAQRLYDLKTDNGGAEATRHPGISGTSEDPLDFELGWPDGGSARLSLHLLDPPQMPEQLSPAQAAQLSELLDYLHIRLRMVIATVQTPESAESIEIEPAKWQQLIDLQGRLAEYLRFIAEPEG